jgi:hypothetical protein
MGRETRCYRAPTRETTVNVTASGAAVVGGIAYNSADMASVETTEEAGSASGREMSATGAETGAATAKVGATPEVSTTAPEMSAASAAEVTATPTSAATSTVAAGRTGYQGSPGSDKGRGQHRQGPRQNSLGHRHGYHSVAAPAVRRARAVSDYLH